MTPQYLDIQAIIKEHQKAIQSVEQMIPQIQTVADRMVESIKNGGTVFWMGNGGSAADAQHMAAELIGRFKLERPAIPSIALTTDTSILTCLANDYDYSIIFERQLQGLCKPQDVVIGLSTSGNSPNVLKGIQLANDRGAYTVGFSGKQGGELVKVANSCFVIPVNETARIQEAHSLIAHILCEYIEIAIVHQ